MGFNNINSGHALFSLVVSPYSARCKRLPERPRHGMVIAPKTDHGRKARFRCKDGYVLEGNITFTKCYYGNWTDPTPKCREGKWTN